MQNPFWLWVSEAMCYVLAQSCLILCDPMECSPPGSSVHEILPARILQWSAMPSSKGSSKPRGQICISYDSCNGRLFTTSSTQIYYLDNSDYSFKSNVLCQFRQKYKMNSLSRLMHVVFSLDHLCGSLANQSVLKTQ